MHVCNLVVLSNWAGMSGWIPDIIRSLALWVYLLQLVLGHQHRNCMSHLQYPENLSTHPHTLSTNHPIGNKSIFIHHLWPLICGLLLISKLHNQSEIDDVDCNGNHTPYWNQRYHLTQLPLIKFFFSVFQQAASELGTHYPIIFAPCTQITKISCSKNCWHWSLIVNYSNTVSKQEKLCLHGTMLAKWKQTKEIP